MMPVDEYINRNGRVFWGWSADRGNVDHNYREVIAYENGMFWGISQYTVQMANNSHNYHSPPDEFYPPVKVTYMTKYSQAYRDEQKREKRRRIEWQISEILKKEGL